MSYLAENQNALLISTTITNVLTIIAVIVGPIAALMIQRSLDKCREADRRRHLLFETLWATRAYPGRLQYKHVEALNMVSLDFKGNSAVIDAWNEYLDKLLSPDPSDEAQKTQFYKERDAKFYALLYSMSQALAYSFSRLEVEKQFYAPVAHGTWAEQETALREGVAGLFKGVTVLPVRIVSEKDTSQPATEPRFRSRLLQPKDE